MQAVTSAFLEYHGLALYPIYIDVRLDPAVLTAAGLTPLHQEEERTERAIA